MPLLIAVPVYGDCVSFPMPSGRYITCTIDVSPDYGGQTRALLMRNRILASHAGLKPQVLTFGAAPDYEERRRILLERGLLLPDVSLLNIYEHYREHDWDAEDSTGQALEDLSPHIADTESLHDGSPWRTTYRPPGARSDVYDYLRPDGTPFLRIPAFVFNDQDTWPRQIHKVKRSGEVAGSFRAVGQWFRTWIRTLTVNDDRSFVFIDSRYVVPHIVPMRPPHIHLIYLMHNVHVAAPRRWDSPANETYTRVLDRISGMDAMVTLTERQRADIAQRRGDTENLFVVPNPVDMPDQEGLLRPRDPRRVAVVARLEPQKRLNHAIKAFAQVVSHVPEAQLDIYGTGGSFRSLQRLVDDLGLSNSIHLHGHDPHAREALWRASAFLLTSSYEGYPLSTLESLSHGCPVVAYDIKYGPREQISHGTDGFLVPEGDISELAERVTQLLRAPGMVEKMSRAAVEKARQHGVERFLSDWAQVLGTAVEQKAHRTRLQGAELEVRSVKVHQGPLSHLRRGSGPALGRFAGRSKLRVDAAVRADFPGRPHLLDSARLELAAVSFESGDVLDLPLTWTRTGDVLEVRTRFALRLLHTGQRSGAHAELEHVGLRLRLLWHNSVWEDWVHRPVVETRAFEVGYSEDNRLIVASSPSTPPTAHVRR